MLRIILISSILFTVSPLNLFAQKTHNITVIVTSIRNYNGVINIGLFKDQPSFKKEIPWKYYLVPKKGMTNGTVRYTIKNIPEGIYGIAVLDDENENGIMDYKFFLPKEGFGFSNFFLSSMKRPKFDDFKFDLKSDKSVSARLKYMH